MNEIDACSGRDRSFRILPTDGPLSFVKVSHKNSLGRKDARMSRSKLCGFSFRIAMPWKV
jgi:hypothetical protein